MARFHESMTTLSTMLSRKKQAPPTPVSPMLELAQLYTGKFAFVDELTNKSHQLIVNPTLAIKIDGRTLPGQVVGITTDALTFLDHYGYQLIITAKEGHPVTVYDEAEDATYQIIVPETK